MMIELRGEIPAISAAFCGNSVYIDFDITPRLRERLWDQTTEREWYDFTHTFSFSRSKLDSLFLGVLIYFGAGLSHLPLRVERHLIKNFHFPPKMETSPSSPRINQTRGEEKWKCENRKSHTKYEFFEEDGFQKIWVRWVASGGAGQSVAAHWKKNTGIGSSYTQQLGEIRN